MLSLRHRIIRLPKWARIMLEDLREENARLRERVAVYEQMKEFVTHSTAEHYEGRPMSWYRVTLPPSPPSDMTRLFLLKKNEAVAVASVPSGSALFIGYPQGSDL